MTQGSAPPTKGIGLWLATERRAADHHEMPIYVMDENANFQPARTDSSASLLVLSVELTAAEIGEALGLTPDRWWVKGDFDFHPDTGTCLRRGHRYHGWEITSQLAKTATPENHLADLLDRVDPSATRVASLASDPRVFKIHLRLSHYTDNEAPGFSFDNAVMSRAIKLGVGLDLGVYVIAEEWDGIEPPPLQHLDIHPPSADDATS